MKQRLTVSVGVGILVGVLAAAAVRHTGDTAKALAETQSKLSALTFEESKNYVDEPLWSQVESLAAPLVRENARIAKAKAMLRYRANPNGAEIDLWESRKSVAQHPWRVETPAGFALKRVGVGFVGLVIGTIATLLSLATVSWAWRFFLDRVRELSSAIRGR